MIKMCINNPSIEGPHAYRPGGAMANERRKQACEMIEHIISELLPQLDKSKGSKIARQLSSLPSIQQSLVKGEEGMRHTLRSIAERILKIANRKKATAIDIPATCSADATAAKDAPAKPKQPPLNRLSISSEESAFDHRAKASRHHLLINLLGEETYNDILSTSEEIRDIRRTSATWTKFSRHCAAASIGHEERPASQTLPRPISELYFNTRLIDAMAVVDSNSRKSLEDMPEPCGCVVQRVDWGDLLEDAKRKLEEYRRFERENVGPEDKLSFSCYGGMCGRR